VTDKDESKAIGGLARAEALTPERRSEIARQAASSRWSADLPQAAHVGSIKVGAAEISCAVLGDGRRVLTQSDMMRALGRARQAKGRAHYAGDVNLPAFITANNLKPFIPSELEVTSSQIEFRLPSGQKAFGYLAELLPEVCEVYIKARKAGALTVSQEHIADQCEILIRGLAKLGIVGLVDEATGYQYIRDKHALQQLLDAYLRHDLAAWAKRFPDEFYRQIFRLRGWEWKGMKVNRPQVVAHYTKNLVYERLGPGILKELETRVPRSDEGQKMGKLHQLFTHDVGHPALAQHLHAVTMLMKASANWNQFKLLIDQAMPRHGDTIPLQLVGGSNPSET
jgi:hypothetical protein